METDHGEMVRIEILKLYPKYAENFSDKIRSEWELDNTLKKSQRKKVDNRIIESSHVLVDVLNADFSRTWEKMNMGERLNKLKPRLDQAELEKDGDYSFPVSVIDQTRFHRNLALKQKIEKIRKIIVTDQTFLKKAYQVCEEQRRKLEMVKNQRNKCTYNLDVKSQKMYQTIADSSTLVLPSCSNDHEEQHQKYLIEN